MDADKREITSSLDLLFQSGDTIELRCVGDRTVNGYYRNFEKLAEDAYQLNSQFSPQQNVYVCLNPVLPDLYARRADQFAFAKKGEGVKDSDVVCRRWLLIDFDAIRPAGVSATDQQKQAATELAKEVYSWLQDELGGACIICCDSGNGMHLLIRLPDRPADAESAWVCERFLRFLSEKFSNSQAKVDTTTGNAARICTLYGTVKRKGSDIPEQPHRPSKIVHVPDPLEPVDWTRLAALVEPYPGDQHARQPATEPTDGANGWDVDQLLAQRQIEYTRDDDYRTESGELATRYEFEVCPFDAAHNDRSAFVIQWQNGAVCFGCHHDGCSGNDWQALKKVWGLPTSGGISASDIILPAQPVVVQLQLQNQYFPPDIPCAAFHGPLGRLVQQFAPHTEASPMAMLVTFLTYFGNVIGRRYYVDIGTRQYFKLFTALVGTTARGRKWTAEENVCRMVDAINPAWATYRHSGLSSGEGLVQTVADHMEGVYPSPAVFTEGEFALVLRKKERKGNSLDGYLRVAWDDAPLSTATRKDPLRVEGSHVSLLVHITPGELKELLSSRDISSGFANRFLWTWSSRPGKVQDAVSFQAAAGHQPHITAMQQAFQQLDERHKPGEPICLRLDDAAREAWPQIYDYLDSVESDEDEGLLVDMNARAPAYVQRIAAIYALADGAAAISTQHLRAAVAVTDYSLATVDYIYSKQWWTDSNRQDDVTRERAAKVLQALPIGQPVMRTQVSVGICKRNRSAAELNHIRDFLVTSGGLQIEQLPKTEQWIRLR